MRKIYTISIVLIINCMIGYAQPVLTELSFSTNFNLETYLGSSEGLVPGGSGANQTWDFSAITSLEKFGTVSVVPVSSAPFYTEYNSNYCLKFTDEMFGSGSSYSMCLISSTSFTILGDTNVADSYPYTDTSIIFTFPYTYNTVINDTYQYSPEEPVYTTTSTYDAYGTIKTPYDTYTNVIRQKTVDSEDGSINYTWFHANPFYLIMDASFGVFGYVTVYTDKNLSNNKISDAKTIALYPNPTNSNLNFQLPNNLSIERLLITDVTGKTVLLQTQNTNQINVQNLSNGLYFVKVFSGSEVFQSKFIKK